MEKKKASKIEQFLALSEAEKQSEINPADRAKGRPLTADRKKRWNRIQSSLRRKAGRPKSGRGVKVISLSVEQGLLKRADAEARRRKISRAQLVARGLEAVLSRRSA